MPDKFGIPLFFALVVVAIVVNLRPKKETIECEACNRQRPATDFSDSHEGDEPANRVCGGCLAKRTVAANREERLAKMAPHERTRYERGKNYMIGGILAGLLGVFHFAWLVLSGYLLLLGFVVAGTRGAEDSKSWTVGERLEYWLLIPGLLLAAFAFCGGIEGGGR
jgi:hypothetical protein